ncbi:hypothetical protein H5202_07690 [Shewanella sp. SG41-4]|uniref:hypothetical protein n=1 Tax=Shewanella sp. SG41-4 TaxID=2760976 RepID=UPI001602A2B5|nr:hypothetical protein [Shewanella sp. SG41-4]MBB1438573.1 hypothetical protein [Shewanella sp. SG41-4]
MNLPASYYIDQETMLGIEKFCKQEERSVLLARVIHKIMMSIFSKQTLASLDKKFLENGFSVKLQIEQISHIAVRELLGRDVVNALDDQLLSDAWKKLYSAGVCPTNIQTSH